MIFIVGYIQFLLALALASPSDVGPRAVTGGCEAYSVQAGDTCASIATSTNATYAQIISWNPDITLECSRKHVLIAADVSNLAELEGDEICVSNPLGNYALPSNSQGVTTIVTTTAPAPTPTPDNTNSNCAEYHLVETGEDCSAFTTKFSITLKDFLFLNPQVWENCTNVWADYYYCVRPVGYISTYPGYLPPTTTKEFIQTPTTDLPYVEDLFADYVSSEPLIEIANGTRLDCFEYIWLENITDNTLADCWGLSWSRDVPSQDFILWNPSLRQDPAESDGAVDSYAYPCTLSASSSYCVALASSTAAPVETEAPPSPRAAGEIANCTSWYVPKDSDTCESVLRRTRLTLEQFHTYNPSVKSDCSGMVIGTYYCRSTEIYGWSPGLTTSTEDRSSATATTATSTRPTGTSIATPTPVQDGMVSNCGKFYKVVGGDGCWAIADSNGIALDDFYSWNPAVKTDCTGLLADVFVCVGLAASPTTNPTPATTTAAAGVSTPTPIQDGMTTTCSKFYFVQSGDGCWAISDANGIALDDFYAWNPAVKTDCTGLQANVYVCIAVA
ncbi:hypothetical protein CCHR01_16987 [Colletotrichum chrysophilum]|uniref:LysM domain-containing protein n=1 Tax=Colletotrichum chrysophilum TaxID=1836956 RepID=A0AAD9E9Z0_9PEZI|nr:hypothetical protein CCHR01_16987 [Colletotrichum chrysophilum]